MTTIIDYVRGATTPLRSALSPADALALATLTYVDFHALAGPRSPNGCLLREVAQASSIRALYDRAMVTDHNCALLRSLLRAAGGSPRFRSLRVRDAVTRIGVQPLAQFGAVTFIDEAGATYVVFRGTDGTAVGWAEDAQFGLDFPTIAQLWAARYLRYAAGRAPGPVTVIGRGSEADIIVDDSGVSRRHLEIRLTHGNAIASDLGSTNGTFVEGQRVDAVTLVDGNTLTIGRTQILFWDGTQNSGVNG